MSVGPALFKALLDIDYYQQNKAYLDETMFPDKVRSLYQTLVRSHERSAVSLTLPEVESLHFVYNPVLTGATKEAFSQLLKQIEEAPSFSPEVSGDLIRNLYKERKCIEIATLAAEIADGHSTDFSTLARWCKEVEEGQVSNEEPLNIVSTDVDDVLANVALDYRWKFNLPELQEKMGGFGGGCLIVSGGRPEGGKTALHVSLTAGPVGWLEQGAKVHIIANEEAGSRVMLREISACSGMNRQEIEANKTQAGQAFSRVKDNLVMIDSVRLTMRQLDAYCEEHRPDILIIDQLDKIQIEGVFARDDQRLKHLYIAARELAKKYNIGVWGVTQVSAEAEGKLYYGYECLDGSKTGKAAECDAIILIGKESPNDGGTDTGYRVLNIPKNKMTGNHAPVPCVLHHSISRYVP